MATPIKWGSEFLVNTIVAGNQIEPVLTALPDGRFVAFWSDSSGQGGDGSATAIKGQILGADGRKIGGEFLVNTTTAQGQSGPVATTLADGRVVVAWTDESAAAGDTSLTAIRARIIDADGVPAGSDFVVNTTTSNDQRDPAIIALAGGGFVVGWTDFSQTAPDTSFTAIRGRIYDQSATPAGDDFVLNPITNDNQAQAGMAALTNGRFVAAWRDASQAGADLSGTAIRAQIFNADGSLQGISFQVNTIAAQNQESPEVTALSGGRFVVTWEDFSQSPDDTDSIALRGQVFRANGVKEGGEFLVNTATVSSQWRPVITTFDDGRFVIVWQDASQTGDDTVFGAIRGQVFNADGTRSGDEFLVNTITNFSQTRPTVTVLADGRFAVAWEDNSGIGGDASESGIKAQIFDPREAAVNLTGTAGADEFHGTSFNDVMSGRGRSDRLFGADGDDDLRGGGGTDRLDGGGGIDELSGGAGDDTLDGGAGGDVLDGGLGSDRMIGRGGNDIYFLDSFLDVVVEGSNGGSDTIITSAFSLDLASYANVESARLQGNGQFDLTGNSEANVLTGNNARNIVVGLGGHDTLYGMGGNDRLEGGDGSDYMDGGNSNDTLLGGAENDLMFGGAGIDVLDGGTGNDSLTGGAGNDRFVFSPGDEAATITDFEDDADRIDLSAFGFASVAAARSFAANSGSNVVFAFATGDILTVANITKAQLTGIDMII